MTKEQRMHYLKGGKFTAEYNPSATDDISVRSGKMVGKDIVVYQNCLNTPMENGQFRFNSPSVDGWIPEEDLKDLDWVDEYIESPEPTTQWCYRMTYVDQTSIFKNFGKGNWTAPMVVHREYSSDQDDYVIHKLSNPKADKVERRVLDMLVDQEEPWETIHPQKVTGNVT